MCRKGGYGSSPVMLREATFPKNEKHEGGVYEQDKERIVQHF